MRKLIAAANWKMNGNFALIESFSQYDWSQSEVEKIFALPFVYLNKAAELKLTQLAAEDVSAYESGAHTGEISAMMLKEIGVQYSIIGHSERRTEYNEDETVLIEKWKQLNAQDIKVIYCIGESAEEYDAGKCEEAVLRQINPVLKAGLVDENTVIAYEPVWAIGTGKAATSEYAQEVHAKIRHILRSELGEVADKVRILYGGSVKPENAGELIAGQDIDGFLVGGASLQVAAFSKIIEAMAS